MGYLAKNSPKNSQYLRLGSELPLGSRGFDSELPLGSLESGSELPLDSLGLGSGLPLNLLVFPLELLGLDLWIRGVLGAASCFGEVCFGGVFCP